MVQVRDTKPETKSYLAAENAGLRADIGEMAAVIAVQAVATLVIARAARVAQAKAARWSRRVVDHDQIKIAIAIVVKERGLRSVAVVIDAKVFRMLAEVRSTVGAGTVVDPELVATAGVVAIAGVAHIQVQSAVAIHIGERQSGGPRSLCVNACRRRHIAEPKGAFVQKQLRAVLVAAQNHFGQTVTIQVTDRDAAAVIEVAIVEHVHRIRLGDVILEAHTGVRRRHLREQRAANRWSRSGACCDGRLGRCRLL